MSWLRSRAGRLTRFGRLVVGLVIASVSVATAVAYWWSLLGPVGVLVVVGFIALCLIVLMFLPERIWRRLTSTDTRADRLAMRLDGATLLRHRFFSEKPPASEMLEELAEWYNETHDIARDMGTSYGAELQAAMLKTPMAGEYIGSGLDKEQQNVARRLDVLIEAVREMVQQLRGQR